MIDNYVETSLNINEINDSKYFSFKSECSCFSHDLKITLEKEKNIISIIFNDNVYIGEDFNLNDNWFKKILFKIKCAWKCLFSDGFEIEHAFIFKGEEHLKQFQKYFNDRANYILNVKKVTTNKHPKRRYNKNLKQKTNKEEINK